jgi:hypothetical protein
MAEVPLTQGRVALVDAEDAEWALGQSWCVTNGYPARGTQRGGVGKVWYMHREILVRAGVMTYYFDPRLTDHVNRDRFDNRRANLRAVTPAENNANRTPVGRSGFLGVEQQRSRGNFIDKWTWCVRRDGVRHRRFGYASPEEASVAREAFIAERY